MEQVTKKDDEEKVKGKGKEKGKEKGEPTKGGSPGAEGGR